MLDNTYKNVFDAYTTASQYRDFLNQYQRLEFNAQSARAAKATNKGFSCVLDGYYESLREYNYACVEIGGLLKFFFVVDGNSENDGAQPSAKLYFERDVFTANYLNYLRNPSYDKNNFVVCRHIDNAYISGDYLYCLNTLTDEENVPIQKILKESDKKVLWAKITTGRELYVNPFGATFPPTIKYFGGGANPINGVVRTFYTPFWDRDGASRAVLSDGTNTQHLRKLKTADGYINGIIADSTEILSIELTWYAPFITQSDGETLTVLVDSVQETFPSVDTPIYAGKFYTYTYVSSDGGEETVKISPNTLTTEVTDFLWGSIVNDLPLLATSQNSELLPDYYYELALEEQMPKGDFPYDLNGILTFDQWQAYEPRLREYPFKYKSLYYNGKFNDIIPPQDATKLIIDIDYRNLPNPEFKMWYDNGSSNVTKYKLQNNGEMQFVADSKEYYLRNNGSAMSAKTLNSVLNIPSDLKPLSLVRYGIGMIQNSVNINAAINDANSARDNYTLPDINALNDIHYQDDMLFVDCVHNDQYFYEKVGNKIRYFGVNLNQFDDIMSVTHVHFDFVQTSNCELPFIPNIEDRMVLENAFNNGVRRWHLTNAYTGTDQFTSVYIMNKNIANLSLTAYTYYRRG